MVLTSRCGFEGLWKRREAAAADPPAASHPAAAPRSVRVGNSRPRPASHLTQPGLFALPLRSWRNCKQPVGA